MVTTVSIPEAIEATVKAEPQPEDNESAKKPARKGKGKKGAAATEDVNKRAGITKIRPQRRTFCVLERWVHHCMKLKAPAPMM